MSNIDRAAEVIGAVMSRWDMAGRPDIAEGIDVHLAVALADAGLLAPDLPKPDRQGRWWAGADGIHTCDGMVFHALGLTGRDLGPGVARRLGLALLAAANHAEEVGRADS